jgi:hypothetical protein
MSWLFSQALVEEFLGDICSDGEPSAPLNGNPIQQAYLPPDRMTAFSRLSRFGMMFKPLTENRGEELLTSYLEAFRARTYQQQEKVLESTEQEVECGITWHESSEKYNQNMSSLKTAQPCVLEDLSEFSKTLPRSGMMQGGLYWEQPTSALRTKEKECGLWLGTPTTAMSGRSEKFKRPGMTPAEFVEAYPARGTWPTPTASAMPCEGTQRIMRKKWLAGELSLEEASAIAGRDVRKAQGKVPEMWPTPQAQDAKHSGKNTENRINQGRQLQLAHTAGIGGKLNPTWVEWLMGWPLGWTDLKPLVTDKSPYVPQKPSSTCHNSLPDGSYYGTNTA